MAQQSDAQEKARLRYEAVKEGIKYAENKENSYNGKFIDLKIQIASIVVGILGATALLGKLTGLPLGIFIIGSLLLITSLLCGLTAIHVLRCFWNAHLKVSRQVYNIWRDFLLNGGDYEQANSDSTKITGQASIVESKRWPHILQTITLIAGILVSLTAVLLKMIK